MPIPWKSGVMVAALVLGCAPSPAAISPATARWLGCYVVSWTDGETARVDSFQVVLGKPTGPRPGQGFRSVWPEPQGSTPGFVGDTGFTAPVWHAAGDSLVLVAGFLSSRRYIIRLYLRTLSGTVFEDDDYIHVQRDSAGRIQSMKQHLEHAALVERAQCSARAT